MFASLPLLIFDDRNIILSDKTKNNVLQKGDFYRIYYSDSLLSLNGIYLHFNITDVSIEPYFNKVKCNFKRKNNKQIIENLNNIEKKILLSLDTQKNPVYRIEEQLAQNFLKIYTETQIQKVFKKKNIEILLKISGIWTNEYEYGITFRFFFIHPSKMT